MKKLEKNENNEKMYITDLPFPKFNRKSFKPREYTTTTELHLEQWIVPSGVTIKLINSVDFGYVILPENTQDKRNFTIPKRLFRY